MVFPQKPWEFVSGTILMPKSVDAQTTYRMASDGYIMYIYFLMPLAISILYHIIDIIL